MVSEPVGHFMQELLKDDPLTLEKNPLSQGVHAEDAVLFANVPAGQKMQDEDPLEE